jgi:diguanylate cyclase (GGDEF)-like protein/putative nucleotidyltransferase with HDIG domain
MPLLDMSDFNRAARVFWWCVTLAGLLVFGYALRSISHLDYLEILKIGAFVLVVLLAGLRPVRVPGTITSFTPGDIFIFLAVLFWGPPAAILIAMPDAMGASFRTSQRWTSRLASPALVAISLFISGNLFEILLRTLQQWKVFNSAMLLVALLIFSAAHFSIHTLLLAGYAAIKKWVPVRTIWWPNYSWISLMYTASASTAGLIYLAITIYGVTSLLAAVPLVAIVFAACHFYFKQAEEHTKAAEERNRATERISRLHFATVEALATAIDAKDEITGDHVYRVQVYACGLAKHFGMGELEIEALKAGALLHDVGKIAVPDYILNKPGKLTAAEFDKMKTHTIVGAQILERVNFPYPVVPIVRHHHERWDGKGYPDGLKGENIPMTARILTVVDVFDAVREDRQYRKAMTRDEACGLLKEGAGKVYDPRVVDAFLENLPIYEAEIAAHKANHPPVFTPSTQAGISESGMHAAPAAGLAASTPEVPNYLKQIKAAHSEVAALYEMAQTYSSSLEVRDVAALMVNRLERMIPFTTCIIYMRQAIDGSAVAAHVFGENADKIRGKSLKTGHGIAGWVLLNARSMSNTDPMLDLNALLNSNETRYRTSTVFPLIKGEEAIGALALYSNSQDNYNSEQLHTMESVARLASTALQHALLYEETKSSAQRDALTGLPNGRALYAQFDQLLAEATQQSSSLAVLSLNLDGLRVINDTYGYQIGDCVLKEVSKRLRETIGESIPVYRIAGDEFISLIESISRENVKDLGERVQSEVDRLRMEVRIGQYVQVGISFGIAEYKVDGQTIDELLYAASMATRLNKAERNRERLTTRALKSAGENIPSVSSDLVASSRTLQ